MTALSPAEFAARAHADLLALDRADTDQRMHAVTPSGIGFCQHKLVLETQGVEPTDPNPNLSRLWGTGIHDVWAAARVNAGHETLQTNVKIECRIPVPGHGTAVIVGTGDEIDPAEPSVTDLKTTDTPARYRRSGPTRNNRWQRHIYALGAVQMGLVPEDGLIVRNVWIDRSGNPEFVVQQEPFDPTLTDEIGEWLSGVFYAVLNDEDGEREVTPAMCEQICEHFTTCRGSLPMEQPMLITADEHLLAVEMNQHGKVLVAEGEAMVKSSKKMLDGINGSTGTHTVRWVEVNGTENRAGYSRLDIRKIR